MTARRAIGSMVGLMALTLTLQAQVAVRPETELQAAIKQELVDGDLKGAIERYTMIARSAGPTVAAAALARLAACYDKLGQPAEARRVYERIVREHPGQKEAVAEAGAWLAANRVANGRESVRIEQISMGAGVKWGIADMSPDGRYVAFEDWTAGPANLGVRDLQTGEHRLLTRDATVDGWAETPLFSPDGKQIAYRWGEKEPGIRLIGVDGTRMRVLLRDKHETVLAAWAPDGKALVAARTTRDALGGIVLISTTDGSVTQLKSTGWRFPTIGGISPDGRFLVYSLPHDPATGQGGVFVLAVDGSGETPLSQGPANDAAPIWSHDGSRVLFTSDRSGTVGLWSIRMAHGRPQGSPELLRENIGDIRPIGFTHDGALYYSSNNPQRDAYIATLEPVTLAVTNPRSVSDQFVGKNFGPEVSPDGTRVAFIRNPGSGPVLVVRSLTTGAERTLAKLTSPYLARTAQWFPDGRSLLIHDMPFPRATFRQVDVETGDARPLFEGPYAIRTSALSRDGKTLFYSIRQPEDKRIRLVRRSLETGEESDLHRTTESSGVALFGLSLSPDGTQLAFSINLPGNVRALQVISIDGGTPREIFRSSVEGGISPQGAIAWTQDNHLVVEGRCGPGDENRLCTIPAAGGELRALDVSRLGLRMQRNPTRMISADGRFAFTVANSQPELWAIRNLLPRESTIAR